jgi:hypothetical protein
LLEPKIFSNEQLVGGSFYMKNDGVKVRDDHIPNVPNHQPGSVSPHVKACG